MPTIECALGFGRKIGTNADLTTSICSSSESSDSATSTDSLCLIVMVMLCCDDGGLDDDGLDEAGDKRDVLKCSGVWLEIVEESVTIDALCWM